VDVYNLSDVVQAALGAEHSVVATGSGTVYAWGDNSFGQLGDGGTNNSLTPVPVSSISTGSLVAAGASHSLALLSDGTVRAWGFNAYGQLGDGTNTESHTPVAVSSLTNVVNIAAGAGHSLALCSDGTVWSWGYNTSGQLGNGSTSNSSTPVQVRRQSDNQPLTGVQMVAAGQNHSLALMLTGEVYGWGHNGFGQLGTGAGATATRAVLVNGVSNAKYVAAGSGHSIAVQANGNVQTWGYNSHGQLGDGTTTNRSTPFTQGMPGGGARFAAGGLAHTLVLLQNGTLRASGRNDDGQLGDGTNWDSTTFVYTAGISQGITLAAGGRHSLVVEQKVAAPAFSPNGGSFEQSVDVTITSATPGALIYYTVDDSDPRTSPTRQQYSAPFTLTATTAVKAVAEPATPGPVISSVSSALFTKTVAMPAMSPNGGTFEESVNVRMTSATVGAEVWYTLDGSEPVRNGANSTQYTGISVPIAAVTVVKAKAFEVGTVVTASATTTVLFAITPARPEFNPPSGRFAVSLDVAITSRTPGATIQYSTDGLVWNPYIGPVPVTSTTTLYARALKSGFVDSEDNTAAYTKQDFGVNFKKKKKKKRWLTWLYKLFGH
jgi:alpha-tubulin suppressor-like RCC1 family protein